jgi:CHAT domain-containing protein
LTRCLPVIVLVFLLKAGASAGAGPFIHALTDPPPSIGQWQDEQLSPDQTHSYPLELARGKSLRIDFYSSYADLLVTVTWPGDKKSLEWNIPKRDSVPISFIADARGTYQLHVRSSEKMSGDRLYRMEIREQKPAGFRDQKQAVVCRRLSNAVQLRRQWTEASLKSAIAEYDKAHRVWKELGDRSQEAAALKNAGTLWKILGNQQMTLACLKEAQAIYSQLGDRLGEIKAINALSDYYSECGEYQRALDLYTHGNASIEDPWENAYSLLNRGSAYYGMNDTPKATEFLNRALESFIRQEDLDGQGSALLYLGYVNHTAKNISAAERYYTRSLELRRATENQKGIAIALLSLGHLYNISGERQKALEYYSQALRIFQPLGNLTGQCTVLEGLAYLYAGLGDNQNALGYYFKALELARRSKDLASEGAILDYISAIYTDLGDPTNALKYSQQSISRYRSMPSILGESYALANMGKILEALGRQKEAVDSYTRGLELSQKGGDRFLEGLLLRALGHLYHTSGQLPEALALYKRALALQQDSRDSVRTPSTLYDLARAERDIGELDPAIQYARRGLEITESLRGKVASLELRGSYLASVHQQYELLMDLFMQLHKQRPAEQSDALALQVSEQARARSMLDSLMEAHADIHQGADPVLLEREQTLQKSLHEKANQQMQLLRGKHSKEEEAVLSEGIDSISEELQSVRSEIKSKSPHYAALTQPRPLGLQEIQASVLDDDTILLEYALGEDRSYLWAATPSTLRSFELPKQAEIESRAKHLRELLLARQSHIGETAAGYQERIRTADDAYQKEAAILSRMLLGPVSSILGSRRLLIVAEGALQYLPFAALPSPQSDSPLIAEHEIVSLPSASVLALVRDEIRQRPIPPKTLAVFADPVFETGDPRITERKNPSPAPPYRSVSKRTLLASNSRKGLRAVAASDEGLSISRLPASRDEANAILALVPEEMAWEGIGFNANRAVALGTDLGQYRIVHFATHGILDDGHPDLSGLVLSLYDEQGHPQDGYLRMQDIYNMKLPVDLVVLSACDSGLGKVMRGEGLIGMVRGFMYAGAARVVASLWKVEDEATAFLMKRFYQRMLQDNLSPAKALRMAQLDMMQQKRWQSPYYWAAFVLQGEWK